LREIGRIERTLFTLDWLEMPELRRQTAAELNKGKARNALARAVCFQRLGRLRDRAVAARQYGPVDWPSSPPPSRSGTRCISAGRSIFCAGRARRLRMRCLPISRRSAGNINLTGDYLWDADAGLGPDGIRLLRLAAIDLHPAVAA
jgi:hypothetical protein